jgi:signal transduction histidine kinase
MFRPSGTCAPSRGTVPARVTSDSEVLSVRGPARPLSGPALAGASSLERRLPLVMTGVLAAGLTVMVAATYETLADRAADIVGHRLRTAIEEIASSAHASLVQREAELQAVGATPAVRAALAPGASEATTRAATAQLAALLTARDSLALVELWDASGRVLAHVGPAMAGTRPVPTPEALRAGQLASPLVADGGRARIWVFAPVSVRGAVAGYVASARPIGGRADVVRTLRQMTGERVTLYTRNGDGSLWLEAPNVPVAPPTRRDSAGGWLWTERGGVRMLAVDAPVARTPLMLSVEVPEPTIRARPRRTLTQLALLALAVTAVGGVISWWISRRITRPLAHLTDAAEELAHGTYEHPVAVPGRDEVGRLAASFDAMARQVVTARQELERRAADAQATADALQVANARLRRTTAEAERARAEADRANRAKSDFLAMMSHELRTPLNAIGGYAELLEMGIHGPVTEAQRDALLRIGRSQAHLLTLINDVLSFARIDAGQVQYAIEDVALHEALAGLEALVAPQVRARGLVFDHRPCDPTLHARADRDKLRQLVLNLLGNAIKYTPDGGTVTLACDADDASVRVHVRDTGVGIPADRLPSIFEAFVQGDRALNRPNDGVGLGLAISRELAHGMGGTLAVESEVGRGSTFTVTLARAPEPRLRPTPPQAASAVA